MGQSNGPVVGKGVVSGAKAKAAANALPASPTIDAAAVQAAADAARVAAGQAAGRVSTILTSGLGDTSKPLLTKKTLLGA